MVNLEQRRLTLNINTEGTLEDKNINTERRDRGRNRYTEAT